MKQVIVPINFIGSVTVKVPDHLSNDHAKILAEKLAVAQILATAENPDCGEAILAAGEEYAEETGNSEEDIDVAEVADICGTWANSAGTIFAE
jgi:hypothetical protein